MRFISVSERNFYHFSLLINYIDKVEFPKYRQQFENAFFELFYTRYHDRSMNKQTRGCIQSSTYCSLENEQIKILLIKKV